MEPLLDFLVKSRTETIDLQTYFRTSHFGFVVHVVLRHSIRLNVSRINQFLI